MKKILVVLTLGLLLSSLVLAENDSNGSIIEELLSNLSPSNLGNIILNSSPPEDPPTEEIGKDSVIVIENETVEEPAQVAVVEEPAEEVVDLSDKDYEILTFNGEDYKAYPVLALVDDSRDEIVNDKVNVRSLSDGTKLKVTNEKQIAFEKDNEETFRVVSSEDIYQIGDIRKTQEWGYLGTGTGTDIITAKGALIQKGQHICVESSRQSTSGSTAYTDCIFYPQVYSGESYLEKEALVDISIEGSVATVTYPLPYDPIYGDLTEGTSLYWFNETVGGNAKNYGDSGNDAVTYGDAEIASSAACHSSFDNCGYTDGSGDYFRDSNLVFTDSNDHTWFCMFKPVQSESQYDVFCGDDGAFYMNVNGGILLNLKDSAGYDSLTLVSSPNMDNSTWYFLWGWNNATHYCGYTDNGTLTSCREHNGNFDDESIYELGGRDGAGNTKAYFQASGIWNSTLNVSEMDCVYDLTLNGTRDYSSCFATSGSSGGSGGSNETTASGSIIFKPGTVDASDGFLKNGTAGITNSNSYWLCTNAACSTTCQADIEGGIITGCS